jgi:hypothetical protein
MHESVTGWAGAELAAGLDTLVRDLQALSLTSATDEQVLDLWRALEAHRRKLAVVDHAIIRQVQQRHVAFAVGAKNDVHLARDVLRITPHEAKARIAAAEACGPNIAVSGEPLPPIHCDVAAAQAAGEISPAHAALIVKTVDRLPVGVQDEHGESAEKLLVDAARELDPQLLGGVAVRLAATLDPDGQLRDVEYRRRHREVTFTQRPDGSGFGTIDATAELAEHLLTLFDALAKPKPEADGVKDPRTAGQRRHDALLDALKMLERAREIGHTGGVTTTVLLTATAEDWAKSEGLARTGHGALVPVKEAKNWAGGDARFVALLFSKTKRLKAVSKSRRFYTETQRLAMIARDQGCCFPGCDAPSLQCEAHHLTDHAQGGPTEVSAGCLLCSYHHAHFQQLGWTGLMINNIPHWTPPTWIDPLQRPRRNTRHHPTTART